MKNKWIPQNLPSQSGKTIIITGANSGLGFASTQALARAGATVVMACRSEERGKRALQAVKQKVPDSQVELMLLDLGSLDSVAAFAEAFARKYGRLDVLLNNAGIMATPFGKTEEGFEKQFGVNHLGHFALTARLMPLLRGTPNSRIVAVSSLAAVNGTIDFDDLHHAQSYKPWEAYGQSKLANLMFALELDRRLKAAGENSISLATHPGGAATNLGNNIEAGRLFKFIGENILLPLLPSAEKGARAQIYAAGEEKALGGAYYGLDGFGQYYGYPKQVEIPPSARNTEDWVKLWEVSERETGLSFGLPA